MFVLCANLALHAIVVTCQQSCQAVEQQLQSMDAAHDFIDRGCGNKFKTRSFNNSAPYLEIDFDTLCHNNCLPDGTCAIVSWQALPLIACFAYMMS